MPSARGQHGQATVELVALLPFLVAVAFGLWQAVVAGQAVWLAGAAARAAARAEALGQDPAPAARAALPPRLEDGLRVASAADGGVRVTLRIPSVLTHGAVASTSARARFPPQAR
jgi:pilus assembly protein CpaE